MAFKDNASAVTRLNDYNLRDLGGSASFEVQTISGRGLAPTRDRELQFPGEVGARNYGSFPAVRRIEVTGLLYANTQPDFRIGLDKLKELCRNRIKLNEVLYGEVEAQTLWFADEGVVHEGTAQAGATTTITLDTSASSTDDYYNDMEVEIIGGTGDGQVRKITDYTGSSRVATIAPLFATTPDSTSQFWIRDNRYYLVNYSGTMNETRITNQWMRTGFSNVTLPFKAVMPFAVSDWKKQNIASVNGGDFQAIETGTAPSYPRYEIKGGGASSTNPAIIETTTAFQSNFNAAQGTGIANTAITPSVSTGIKHQSGKLNQAIEFDGSTTAPDKFEVLPKSAVRIRTLGGQAATSIADTINLNQGTLAFWVKRNNDWGTGTEYFYSNYGTWGMSFFIRNNAGSGIQFLLNDGAGGGGIQSVSTATMTAGAWYYIVARWDQRRTGFSTAYSTAYTALAVYDSAGSLVGQGNNAIQPYLAGNNTNTIEISSIGAFYYWVSGENSENFKGQIDDFAQWDRPLTDSEITTLVNGGTGARADSVGSSDLIYYSDFDGTVGTDMVNPIASSNVDTAYASVTTTTAVTVNGNGDKIFADNDRIVLYDETGYKVQGAVNGTATTTNVPIDNLAGGAVTDADKVGVHATASWSYSNKFGANAQQVGDITTGDFTVSLWFKMTASSWYIIDKRYGNYDSGWDLWVSSAGVHPLIEDSTATSATGTVAVTGLDDGKWHHLMVSFDRSGDATVYTDGVARGTVTISGASATITTSQHLWVGGGSLGGLLDGTGSLRDVAIWNSALTAANALSLATNPLNATAAVSIPAWWWKMDEAWSVQVADSGSVTGADVLGVVGTVTRTQLAYISKNLIADGNMENGGIGGWTPLDSASLLAKESTIVRKDAESLKITNDDATVSGARQTITTASGEDWVVRDWVYTPSATTYAGTEQLFVIDQVVNQSATPNGQLGSGFTGDNAWHFTELCFEADQTDPVLMLRPASTTSGDSIYHDATQLLPNLVNNGGMEGTWTGAAGAEVPPDWNRLYSPNTYEITSGQHSGSACLQMDNEYVYQTLPEYLTLGDFYEVSWWVKVVSGSGGSRIRLYSGAPYAAWVKDVSGPTGSESGWNRYSEIVQVPTTLSYGQVISYLSCWGGIVIQVDDVSIVHRPDLSPTLTAMSTNYRYEPTRLGMGYHTGGNENMVYAAVGNKGQSAGRVVFRPQFPYDIGAGTNNSKSIFVHAANSTNYIELFYYAPNDEWWFAKNANGSYVYARSVQQNFSANDEVEVGWYTDPSSGIQIFVNGSASGSTISANTDSLATNPATLYVGNYYNFTQQTNNIIDDLEILTKSMPAEWFAEQYAKRLASKNQNLYLSYYGTLDTGDILTLDCASTKTVTRAELYDASAGTRTSAINNATIYGSKMPILSERKSMLYFPATISNGVDIHFKKSWQ